MIGTDYRQRSARDPDFRHDGTPRHGARDKWRAAHEAGQEAFSAGGMRHQNPWKLNSECWAAWDNGWQDEQAKELRKIH